MMVDWLVVALVVVMAVNSVDAMVVTMEHG